MEFSDMKPRILSYPPKHDYVDRLKKVADFVFEDETWPELTNFYNRSWLKEHKEDYDIAHFHFTWEQYSPNQFELVLNQHRLNGKPIVWTAHDLRIPHTFSSNDDEVYLEILAKYADKVITLTPGASMEIKKRFDVNAEIIPHGPILNREQMEHYRGMYDTFFSKRSEEPIEMLFHGKHLRPNIEWKDTIKTVHYSAYNASPFNLTVLVESDIPNLKEVMDLASDYVRVFPCEPLTFDQLCTRLARSEVLILPYLWGTHSGLVELAADIGISVITTDAGYWFQQHDNMLTFHANEDGIDRISLMNTLDSFLDGKYIPISIDDRMKELDYILSRHEEIYSGLINT